ncbi:CLUMA_CG005441, isoform A [Clunio marinus]|uniref:CLUMA_CG005441, isoform A n=1 Tax=Clunio marinus TaxID=568069 RepID=A0A1J1HUR7_9DIPT|nr:CLUMA_CG005441, isoform A [Clunio marinus]
MVQEISTNSSSHSAFITYENYVKNIFAVLNRNNLTTPIHTLDEIIAVAPRSMSFVANMELFKTFDEKLTQLREAGIMDHIKKPYYELYKEKPNNDPKVLTMDDLSAGFVVFLVFLLISIASFSLEIIIDKLTMLFNKYLKGCVINK